MEVQTVVVAESSEKSSNAAEFPLAGQLETKNLLRASQKSLTCLRSKAMKGRGGDSVVVALVEHVDDDDVGT